MGSKRNRSTKFLAEHPLCCFCGGNTPAQEIDHIPSRVLFDNREWPEGYTFPACIPCNRASRHDEQIVAMLSRIFPDQKNESSANEIDKRIKAVANNYPGLLEEMQPTVRQIRDGIKKYGIKKPPGMSTTDMPLLHIGGPLVNSAVEQFGRKLSLALYYKHTGKILPSEGGVAIRWYSNLQIENEEIPRQLADVVHNFPKLERCKTSLHDQFFYRYGITDTQRLAVFLAFFRGSFAILGYINHDATAFKLPPEAKIFSPFHHKN